MNRIMGALGLTLLCLRLAHGDAGVLLPGDRQQPDPAVFSLDEMWIDIVVDNGDARVAVRQIFGSHTGAITEGTYTFALPERGMVSDFAIWEDLTRIPGVILERRRAEEIYENLKQQTIDPGLLQQGERDYAEARRSNVFTATVVPIPPFGTKRIEIEYHERLAVESFRSNLAVPLRPDAYQAQTAGVLHIGLEMRSQAPLRAFQAVSKAYPLRIAENAPNIVRASFDGRSVPLNEDFNVRWEIDPVHAGALDVEAYRNAASGEPGFVEASALLPDTKADDAARSVIALFDTSLSMQWEKLERSYRVLDGLLHSLRPADHFNLLLFNSRVTPFAPAPVEATIPQIEKAIAFVRSNSLRGGTDLDAALAAALAQKPAPGSTPYVVLISDCGATEGSIRNSRVAAKYSEAWKRLAAVARPRTYVFGVGDDANLPLARLLARNDGLYETVRSTEPVEFKLEAFLAKLGKRAVAGLDLAIEPKNALDLVYPLENEVFPGSVGAWIGQYRTPGTQVALTAGAAHAQVTLPADDRNHPQLPRTWAKARVDALLDKIERDGEDRASIDEIIRLSRKYKFVTPYTSFLAAPRALLRPRMIRPGDPLIRVKTDPAITSVMALFPFGLTKPLRYLKEEDIWQTRFLAPPDLADGTYQVRLILRDREGRVYREAKSFMIASKPPVVKLQLASYRFRAGETMRLKVKASENARTIVARMYGAAAVSLRWNQAAGASTGDLTVPALPPGKYPLQIVAEDAAHNIGSQEVSLEVLP